MNIQVVKNIAEWLPAIYALNLEVFDESIELKLDERLKKFKNPLLLVDGTTQNLNGYKFGYELDNQTFYSWLGAVSPKCRRLGIGKALMRTQHAWCQERGYEKVHTKTLNRWKNMLILNLAEGFDIVDTYQNKQGITKILLEKTLR